MELSSLQPVFFFFLLPLFFFLFFYQNPAKKRNSTKLKTYPLLGNLPQYLQNRHRFLEWSTEILIKAPTYTVTLQSPGQVSGVITANTLNVEHMLKTNFVNYPRGERSIAMLEDFLGQGIFNSDGEHWKWQRKAASYEFNKKSLRNFVVDMCSMRLVKRLLPLLKKASKKNEIVNLQDVLERFAFDNICKVAFNEDPACLAEERSSDMVSSDFMKAFEEAQNIVVGRFLDALKVTWRIKKLLNIGSERRLKQLISIVHNYSMNIIRSRRERPLDQYNDLLSRFASNKDNTEEFLRDVVTNFLIAGRETTSSALTWFFWLLSTRPDVEKKILEEVRSVQALNQNSNETFSFDELREMHYLHAAISESMRLYPPVPIDTQSCKEDDTMPDRTFVGKGWSVTYSAYAMGRMEHIWGKDCNDYKPERWLENGVFQPENPFKYPVFHAGPRMCLGKEMAYIQMKSIVACVLERFEINVVGKDKSPEHILSVTLRMKGGLPIQVKERELM
ncbi:LOW QUALITY PROTEIN: cytochrome P450 94A1 [Phoenix dactylifera]|uniref:LOW QUALITY PROTEIN: cytochrome P450 94A1 n=1 Tax=Phoenix dactylifera TaxID=42345 RepID=A0A8B7BZH5_PHODC|nr:LOW QUALITY PROTEIN: cytochrome P450 94A1 [Phoenix dactylifera]